MTVDPVRAGTFSLRRVPGSNPPEWRGEATVHGMAYALRGEIEMQPDGLALVGSVLWSPKVPGEA